MGDIYREYMYMRPTIGAWHTDTHKRGPQDKRNRAHRTEANRAIEAQRSRTVSVTSGPVVI